MPGVSTEQIEQAKQWDLLSYLKAYEPGELKKTGLSEYRTHSHDSLVISNGKWHWCSQNIGGRTALDFLIKVRGFSFVEAVQSLSDSRAAPFYDSQPVIPKPSPPKKFALPPFSPCPTAAINYLQKRGIDAEIIADCINRSIIMESRQHKNCMFVGRDSTGKARFTCLRGTMGDFKMDAPGSDKRFGFCLPPADPERPVVSVYESPIDALSQATMRKQHGKIGQHWNDRYFLSLGGTAPLALLQLLKDHPQIDTVFLALDNDKAGQEGAARIEETIAADPVLSQQVKEIQRHIPFQHYGKDWNDVLLGRMAEMKQKNPHQERSCER